MVRCFLLLGEREALLVDTCTGEGDLKAVTPTDFDRAAQIIRETRKLIGEGLNSPAETGTEEDPEDETEENPEDETEEENEDETEDWEDGE